MFHRIELITGFPKAWLPLRLLLLSWGGVAIVFSTSPWPWTMLALLTLFLADRYVVRSVRLRHRPARATLGLDGVLRLQRGEGEQLATWTGRAWVCRWFCLVDWECLSAPRRGRALVCAADNHPDDFRRLRVLLRLGHGEQSP
jgi:hypothetical protein